MKAITTLSAPSAQGVENGDFLQRLVNYFQYKRIRSIFYKGQLLMVARDVGHALGYAKNGMPFVQSITGDWATELGDDVLTLSYTEWAPLLSGDRQSEVPDELPCQNSDTGNSGGHRGSMLFLTRDGLVGACNLSRKPLGLLFRKWAVKEVFAQIFETGSYIAVPPASVAQKALSPAQQVDLLVKAIKELRKSDCDPITDALLMQLVDVAAGRTAPQTLNELRVMDFAKIDQLRKDHLLNIITAAGAKGILCSLVKSMNGFQQRTLDRCLALLQFEQKIRITALGHCYLREPSIPSAPPTPFTL